MEKWITDVMTGDVLEYITWGGGGLGSPLTRPATRVAQEVHRKLVSFGGARNNYGVVVRPEDFSVDEPATSALREEMQMQRDSSDSTKYNRGGTMSQVLASCEAETGLKAPRPQWERDAYGPHVGLEYVKGWYGRMREGGMGVWDGECGD